MKALVPDGKELLPFQIEAVEKMLSFLRTNRGVYNAAEMGLGKSIMTIAAINAGKPRTVLIICPAVMRLTWADELSKWLTREYTVQVALKRGDPINADIVILSYNLAAEESYAKALAARKFDFLVCDESHYLKSRSAKRTKSVLGTIWGSARYKIALSGTPFTQSVVDGFTLFHLLAPEIFPNFHRFAESYAYSRLTPWGRKYFGVKNPEALSSLIRGKFFIRYKKSEVLTSLPDRTFSRITLGKEYSITLSKDEQSEYDEYKKRLEEIPPHLYRSLPQPPKSIGTLRQKQTLLRVTPIIEFCKNFLEQDIPILLWCWHLSVIDKFKEAFYEYAPAVIQGQTNARDRFEAVRRFQDGETNLFIGQMAAAGVGITLTRGSTVIFAELDYSPAVIDQAISRVHRHTQKNAVTAYYFHVPGSFDEQIVNTVLQKMKAFKQVIDG